MRAVGLAVILLGVLTLVYPYYEEWVPFITLRTSDAYIFGGLLIALGGLTLAIYRNS